MEYMHELKEKLCTEVDEIARKPEMKAGDLEMLHKLTDTIKNLAKIEMLDEAGYSEDGWGMEGASYGRGSYAGGNMRTGGGSSYAQGGSSYLRGGNRRRDSRGRYSRDGYSGGYSGAGGKEEIVEQLEGMMQSASNERERRVIRQCMEQLENI